MTRLSQLSSPLLLGFEEMERVLERITKSSGDGFPPYNIERVCCQDDGLPKMRITLAVAGFEEHDLDIIVEGNQLLITGHKKQEEEKDYLHKGIAFRQFKKSFVLADGIEVTDANLQNGLLSIDLYKPQVETKALKIKINT